MFWPFGVPRNLLPADVEHRSTRVTDICALSLNADDGLTGMDLLPAYYLLYFHFESHGLALERWRQEDV